MTYQHLSLAGVSALGASDRPECAYFLANYGDPQWPTYLPAQVCPVPVGKTGHDPPRARPCDGGISDLRDALTWLGYPVGPYSKAWTPGMSASVAALSAKYGLPYDGTQWGVTPEICSAVVYEMKANLPYCTEQDARTMHGDVAPCWSNRAAGGRSAARPGAASQPAPAPETAPAPQAPTTALRSEALQALLYHPVRAEIRVPPRTTDVYTAPPAETAPTGPDWWSKRSSAGKVGIVVGGLALVGVAAYVALKR